MTTPDPHQIIADALRYCADADVRRPSEQAVIVAEHLAGAGLLLTEANTQAAADAVLDAIGAAFRAKLTGA